MKINKILIDLDDTLNDFTMDALRYIGCPVNGPRDFGAFDPDWKFDIVKAANCLMPFLTEGEKFTLTNFWNQFNWEFWANLQKSEEFVLILDSSIEAVGPDKVLICTTPICGPEINIWATTECLKGKYVWIENNLPEYLHRSFSMTPQKHFCATPETLLIDDSRKNVDDFRAAGGHAILVPRPWNSVHRWWMENSLLHVEGQLKRFFP